MNNFSNIYDYIQGVDNFNDDNYNYLINLYGSDDVNSLIILLLREREEDIETYMKIVGNSNDKCASVITNLLLPRVVEIVDRINEIIGKDNKFIMGINLIPDRVSYIREHSNDIERVKIVNELYDEFLIIRNRICEYYLYLVDEMAKKYIDEERYWDMYQYGVMGLLNSIEKYNCDKGEFVPYAINMIKGNIGNHHYDLDLTTYVPSQCKQKYYKLFNIINRYFDNHNRLPSKKLLSRLMKVPEDKISFYFTLQCDKAESLYDGIVSDGEYLKKIDIISDGDNIRDLEDESIDNNLMSMLMDLFDKLSDREKKVLYEHYFKGKKIRDLADEFNVTHQAMSLTHCKALKKLGRYKRDLRRYLR